MDATENNNAATGACSGAKNESYRYFAFISYGSKDAKSAKSLQRRSEAYKLSATLCNEPETERDVKFPKRLAPIFRDITDLEAGVWGRLSRHELQGSKFLIVVCSSNSATSAWVNQEVESFILMKRYDRIILYIVDGEPNASDPSQEAFPPILRRKPEFLTYDSTSPEEAAGFVVSRRYQRNGVYDGYVGDADGVVGFRYKLDDLGRVVETIYLDVEGNGVIKRKFDESGNVVRACCYNSSSPLCNRCEMI